jgi:hypothetical protein
MTQWISKTSVSESNQGKYLWAAALLFTFLLLVGDRVEGWVVLACIVSWAMVIGHVIRQRLATTRTPR